MGINVNLARGLMVAKRAGASFAETATVGRLGLNCSLEELGAVLREDFRLEVDDDTLRRTYARRYAEGLFELLGASRTDSFDVSAYEGATNLHDFNQPIPERFHGAYSCVVDGGALEHIFDFPRALKNCMEMVAVGGHLILNPPTNNYMGHGFYQVSPETYFRALGEENGFTVERCFLYEGRDTRRWFTVADPARVEHRVGYTNAQPTLLLVIAKRTSVRPIFASAPQQSDYATAWEHGKESAGRRRRGSLVRRLLPGRVVDTLKGFLHGFRDPEHFGRFTP